MTSTSHELSLLSTSRASDGAYLALVDVARMASQLNVDYRVVGGNAVTLLSGIYSVDHLVPIRETADVDFGASYQVVSDERLPAVLMSMRYERVAGNRFLRTVPEGSGELTLAIDVLAPSYENRLVANQKHGELFVDEVPGLAFALARPPVTVALNVTLTSGIKGSALLRLPDVVAALCLKAYAYLGRMHPRDALDIWRLMEAAHAAGLTRQQWPSGPTTDRAADILRQHFASPAGGGARSATKLRSQQLRIRALAAQLIPAG